MRHIIKRFERGAANFALFLSLFATDAIFSQSESYTIRIIDQRTKEPVPECYVLLKGKNVSSISDEKGVLTIKASENDTLVFYQLGYTLKAISTNDVRRSGNIVTLSRKTVSLEEVTISGAKAITFRENDNCVFLDFIFYDDYLLCLINKGEKFNALLLADANGTTLYETRLRIKAEKLFKDCLDNVHLLTEDSVYQIYYDYQKIKLLPPYPISSYYTYLQPCECAHALKYIFKQRQYHNQKNLYTYYDFANKFRKELVCVADTENIRDFNMDFDLGYFLGIRRGGEAYLYSVAQLIENLDRLREELVLDAGYASLLKPVASEMRKIDTNFVLFNYTHGKTYYFSMAGRLQKVLPLPPFAGISPKLYIDSDARTCIFAGQNRNNGHLTLYRFDRHSNRFSHRFALKDYHYIKDFKIKENNLYFISRVRVKDDFKSKIVKVPIAWERIRD